VYSLTDTIIACSSPPGRGAISIIRISGGNLTELFKKIGIKKIGNKESLVKELQLNSDFKEKCVLTFFKSPNSFTGEDVLEINCHGNPLMVEIIINFFLKIGCRKAGPGEFTMRGFLNNKISFLEAEAIDDLISAESEEQLLASAKSLSGKFEKKVDEAIKDLKQLRVYAESNIDFSDQEILEDFDEFKRNLTIFIRKLEELISKTNSSKYLIEGVTGPPNVGKSTLMNILTEEKTSIVSEIQGTTRDLVQKSCKINNINFSLYDTAGIHEGSSDPIEQEGIALAKSLLDKSDVVIEIVDNTSDDYFVNYKKPVIRVKNKIDISQDVSENRLNVSLLNRIGIKEIKDALFDTLNIPNQAKLISFSARSRHTELMKHSLNELKAAASLSSDKNLELIAEHLRRASNFIGEIKSPYSSDDLLGEIFSSFCIGK
jgi:tRNA modification GTPase